MDTVEWAKQLRISPGDQIGKFIVERPLGQGGTAAVYKGRSALTNTGTSVAIKILNQTMLDLDFERARLDLQLRLHDHACPYLIRPIEWFYADVSTTDGRTFPTLIDVSEYIDGLPLNPTLLSDERVWPVISMIAIAARYLEQRGFCHRDIKPENIIVTPDARKAVLLDLGVLHALQRGEEELPLTGAQTSQKLVTRRYSSPEILNGSLRPGSANEEWLAHTIYQIGAIICEAITERTLFEGKEGEVLISAILQKDPLDEKPITRCRELEVIARRCLSKIPRDRLEVTWESLECKRLARKPTVVLLYCGGTIGASTDPRGKELLPRKLSIDSPLPSAIKRRITRDFLDLVPDSPLPAIEWRFVEEKLQVFSENAEPETWNGISDAVSGVLSEDWSNKYLLGLVLLHGTDTLAYTAAALQLAFPKLPCPVVVTGSNQPPGDELNEEGGWKTSQSDAWSNLLRSILFLIDGGHRLPMVYIAFSNTICHAVNAQKTPLNRIPLRFAAAFRFLTEAFGYRNVELGRRFAFKYVEGVLVNNFLPILEKTAFQPAGASWERPQLAVEGVRPITTFSSAISAVTVLPCRVGVHADDCNLQLVIAFPSGTISESMRSGLAERNAIVTQWGLSPHQAAYYAKTQRGSSESETKLFRVIPETALPLLSLAMSRNGVDVESGLVEIVNENPIVGALLGNPLNRELQRERAKYVHDRAANLHQVTIGEMLFPMMRRDSSAVLELDAKSRQQAQPLVLFRLGHWEALIYGLVAPFAHAGSIAEQFGALCDIGFDTGASIAFEWSHDHDAERPDAKEELMKEVILAIRASGLARVRVEFLEQEEACRLKIQARLDSRYPIYVESWAFDSCEDHRFLAQLEHGIPLKDSDRLGEKYFANELERLHGTNKVIRTSPVYWYILGIIKGALCWWVSERGGEPLRSAGEVRPSVVLRLHPGKGESYHEAELILPLRLIKRRSALQSPEQD